MSDSAATSTNSSSNKNPDTQRALVSIHLASVLFGGTALFSKILPLAAVDIIFFRCWVASATLAVILQLRGETFALTQRRDYGIALALGCLVGLHWVTYFLSMQVSTVAIGMVSLFSYPVITVLLEPLSEGRKPPGSDLAMGLVVLAGVALMVPELNLGHNTTLGVALGIISAFFFAIRNILYRHSFSRYSGSKTMLYQCLVTGLLLIPFVGSWHPSQTIHLWPQLLLLGTLFTAVPHSLLVRALRAISAKTVSLISCLQPVYGALAAAILLSEVPSVATYCGGSLVLGAAIFETVKSR
ncbi:MAG: DMT family transporter [Polyangiaceae bacterium]|nr:DMT family transporter [Polyangiaceae bacterium]